MRKSKLLVESPHGVGLIMVMSLALLSMSLTGVIMYLTHKCIKIIGLVHNYGFLFLSGHKAIASDLLTLRS